eukprot:m.35573 g.35573  ORF g.35573 m.35573 type:complete len:118 (+) comp6612_c0_seq2:362-715(+)
MKAFKVAMLGDSGTGKSCIIGQLAMNKFLGKTNVTVGADSTFQRIELGSGDMIQMNIWDTAGLEQFRSIAPMYIRGAQVRSFVATRAHGAGIHTYTHTCRHTHMPTRLLMHTKYNMP